MSLIKAAKEVDAGPIYFQNSSIFAIIINIIEKESDKVGLGRLPQPSNDELYLSAGGRQLSVPLNADYIDVAITLLSTLKSELMTVNLELAAEEDETDDESFQMQSTVPNSVSELELGGIDQFDVPTEAQG